MSRILHILSQIPSQTGSGVFLDNMIQQGALRGHDQAAVVGLPYSLKDYPIQGLNNAEIYPVLFETEALPFKIPGMSDVMPYESSRFNELSTEALTLYKQGFYQVISQAVSDFKPDLIIANHLWVATAVALNVLADLENCYDEHKKRPHIFAVCHGTDLRQLHLSPKIAPEVLSGLASLDGVFCLHQHQLEEIHLRFGLAYERLFLTGNGYNDQLFYRPEKDSPLGGRPLQIVYAGKLAYAKGLLPLLQAVARLDPARYRLSLAGRGSGIEAETILNLANASPVPVSYLGHLSQAQLAEVFRQSDIFVLPSFYEGLPLVVLEALACGLQVVVSELDGLREWLGETIMASGMIHLVPLPELEGIDTCKKTAEGPFSEALSAAIHGCMAQMPSEDYYGAIAARSWSKVFEKMETVCLSWGSKPL